MAAKPVSTFLRIKADCSLGLPPQRRSPIGETTMGRSVKRGFHGPGACDARGNVDDELDGERVG